MTTLRATLHREQSNIKKQLSSLRSGLLQITSGMVAISVCTVFGGTLAYAHPEEDLNYRLMFHFKDNHIDAIGEFWTLDPNFSQQILGEFDTDNDGVLSDKENTVLAKTVLNNLSPSRYFTYVWVDGRDISPLKPFGFHATAHNGVVSFTFGLHLPTVINPTTSKFRIQIKDPTYTLSITPSKKGPVTFRGGGQNCQPVISAYTPDDRIANIKSSPDIVLKCAQ